MNHFQFTSVESKDYSNMKALYRHVPYNKQTIYIRVNIILIMGSIINRLTIECVLYIYNCVI